MVLWNEEDEPDDECDDDDGPSEGMSWYPCQERYEEIVYRLIYCRRYELSDGSWFFYIKKYHTLASHIRKRDDILS